MAINTEFLFDYVNRRVYHDTGTTVYSVNALYSHIQDTFDELAQMDDTVPMSAQTPIDYTMINGWFIDDESVKWLSGGAIQTDGWADEIHTVSFASGGYTSAIAADIGKVVNDDGVDFGTLLAYDNTLRKWWIRTGSATTMASGSAVTIDDSGTGAGTTDAVSETGESIWANPYSLGSIEAGTDLYIEQGGSIITSWWSSGHIDVLIKVSESDTPIASSVITIFARELSDVYDYFESDFSSGGRQAIPLATSDDISNQSTEADIEDLQDGTSASVAVTYGSFSADVTGDGLTEDFVCQIDCDGERLSDVYEVTKYWTQSGSTKDLNGSDGGLYISANASYSAVKGAPFGTFAGGKFFAAQGVYFTGLHANDVQAYELIDSAGDTKVPPNLQSIAVTSLGNGDSVFVAGTSGGSVNKSQYSLDGANGTNTITVTGSIPVDTPATGTIVVVNADGTEVSYSYTAWSGSDFTVTIAASTHDGTATAYVPYIYGTSDGSDLSVSLIYTTDRTVTTVVRQKGILPFEIGGTFGSTGLTVPAIRTADGIVT